jgi:hypothetical protein
MTMPDERSRTVFQTGAFLKELRANQDLPEAIRNEAHRLLRHYPSVSDIELIATFVPANGGRWPQNPFDGPADPNWWLGYRFGPVTGSED